MDLAQGMPARPLASPAWWPISADGTVVPESSEDLRHFAQVSADRASIKEEPVVGRVIVGKLHRDRTDLSGIGELGDKAMTPSSRSRGIRNKRTTSLISTTTPWARLVRRRPSPTTAPRLGLGLRRGPTVDLPQPCGPVPRAVL